mgnify:CR=1 FL=1
MKYFFSISFYYFNVIKTIFLYQLVPTRSSQLSTWHVILFNCMKFHSRIRTILYSVLDSRNFRKFRFIFVVRTCVQHSGLGFTCFRIIFRLSWSPWNYLTPRRTTFPQKTFSNVKIIFAIFLTYYKRSHQSINWSSL